jgi:D-glycero-alpha-D-manno-heptose 1-phosphate guanylyltransferase
MRHSLPGKSSKPELTGTPKADLPATVVLAGGLGTRLRAAYAAGPKSMAPMGRRPFLDYLLRWLRSEGARDVILCVGYKRVQIQRYVGKGRKWGLRVTYSIEKELLGTGGAVKKAERLIPGKRLLVINGDTFLDVNLSELVRFHCCRKALATLAVVKLRDIQRYGSLRVDHENRITTFLEKSERNTGSTLKEGIRPINAGVYVFEKKLLSRIRTGEPASLEKKIFPQLLTSKKVYAFITNAYFIDIGVPDDFRRAEHELPKRFRIHDPR